MTSTVPRVSSGHRWLVLAVCCSALFMVTMDTTILNVALPALQRDFRADVAGLQWTIDAFVLVRGVLLFASGSSSDRFGRRRLFQIGIAAFSLASLACSVAPSLPALIGFRCLQAVGAALMTPASLAIITNTFTDPAERAQAIGFWSGTTGLSTAAGPILGGLLVETVGWRSVFWVNVPIGLAVLVLTRSLPESKSGQPRRFDLGGQFAMMVALGSLIYALIDAPRRGWLSPVVLVLLVLAAVGAAGFWLVEHRTRQPLLDPYYFRRPELVGAVLLAVVGFIALGGFLFFNSLYLQEVRGFRPIVAGGLVLPVTMTTLVLSPLSGRLTARRGAALPASLACLLIAAAMAVQALTIGAATPVLVLGVGYLLLGCGMGLLNAPITNAAVSSLPRSQAGVAGATTSTARQIGISLGVALLGSIVFSAAGGGAAIGADGPAAATTFTEGMRYGYLVAAALALACVPLSRWAFRHRVADAVPEP